jgi:hypothetical protein
LPAAIVNARGKGGGPPPTIPQGITQEPSGFQAPVAFDVPSTHTPLQTAFSPVTGERVQNQQEMQSGADVRSGVFASSQSGGDYSREQGVGRAPGWRWPWNQRSLAFNFQSLDRWAIERTGLGLEPAESGINPYVGVQEPAYSPITAMDQFTMYYEQSPDQHYQWPAPVIIRDAEAPSLTSQAVIG